MAGELTQQELETIGVRVRDMSEGLEEFYDRTNNDLDKRVDARVERIRAQLVETVRGRNAPAKGGLGNEATDTAGFASFGEFAHAVRFDQTDQRLRAIVEKRDMTAGTGTQGGFAIPSGFLNQLFQIPQAASIFQGRITMLPPGDGAPDAPVTFPALDQSGSNGLLAGVEVEYVSEGGAKPETNAVLRQVTLEPLEIAAKIIVSDRLLRNWREATSVLPGLLGQATAKLIDADCYNGTGAGTITGYRGSGATITVDRSVANEINYIDLANMCGRALWDLGPFIWVVSQSALPQFLSMTDGSGDLLWLKSNAGMDVREGQLFSFMNMPLFVLDSAAALGSAGDVSLIAPKAIVGRQGSGPLIESSPHVYFESNRSVLKITTNFDARPWLAAPLTLGDGSTVSPFVILAA